MTAEIDGIRERFSKYSAVGRVARHQLDNPTWEVVRTLLEEIDRLTAQNTALRAENEELKRQSNGK